MSDDPRIPPDDDAAFREWKKSRPNEPDAASPSATFLEMMRQAAARSQDDPDDDGSSEVPPAPADKARRRRTPPALTSDDISAAVRAAGESFNRAADPAPEPPQEKEADRPPTLSRRPRLVAPPLPSTRGVDAETKAEAPPDVNAETAAEAPLPSTSDLDAETEAPDDPTNDETIIETPGDAVIRAQMRQRMIEARRERAARRQKPTSALGGFIRSFILVFAAAGLMATIFTWWTPPRFINEVVSDQLSLAAIETRVAFDAVQPTSDVTLTPISTPNWALRIGVVSGHRGNDSGAVCPDGLTEASINFNVATMVVRDLRAFGYTVDLLDEFDPRLNNYQAVALVSIHANSCQDYGYTASGYLISAAAARPTTRSVDDLLVECVAREYGNAAAIERLPGVTIDMTDYHAFREIHPQTPAAILELGFMLADRDLLTNQAERLAQGIVQGVLCFVEPARDVLAPTATPTIAPEVTAETG